MKLTPQQEQAYEAVKAFLTDSECSVFILKGYAGTGKTTMVKALIPLIKSLEKSVYLMAPTGRAARVLTEKTGVRALTIHKSIYSNFRLTERVENEAGAIVDSRFCENYTDEDINSITLKFSINTREQDYSPETAVIIVDEASMVSASKSQADFVKFGTDILLNDLLTFARPRAGAKIIFVGDPAQLPPVSDSASQALNEDYFANLGLGCRSFTLTEVIRQARHSLILHNAMKIRDFLENPETGDLCFSIDGSEVTEITSAEVVRKFVERQSQPAVGDAIIICSTNALVKQYNDAIRARYYPGRRGVQPGDVLMVVKNNYLYDLYNGDFVKVVQVLDDLESQSARLKVERDGMTAAVTICLSFRNVVLEAADKRQFSAKIIVDLLESPRGAIDSEQNTSLYVNFLKRHPGVKRGSAEFLDRIQSDPYLNAVHAKYGYAVTCHKAQGGEWPLAFVDFTDRNRGTDDTVRWLYTATTRASRQLYGVLFPKVRPMVPLRFKPIAAATKNIGIPVLAELECDLLPADAKPFRKAKCNTVRRALAERELELASVRCLTYCDRYCVVTPEGPLNFDCFYNGRNVFTRFRPLSVSELNDSILETLQLEPQPEYKIDYVPPTKALADLHTAMVQTSRTFGIEITQVTAQIDSWKVIYDLKTSGRFAYIIFYFDKQHRITSAQPASDLLDKDHLLNTLIHNLTYDNN